MKFNLKIKVLPNGFNKRAVILAFGFFGIIVITFILYVLNHNALNGSVGNSSDNSSNNAENKKIEINDEAASLAAILAITNNPKPNASASIANASSSNAISNINPTLISNHIKAETEFDKQAKQIDEQAQIKKLQAKYQALDSKASMIASSNKSNSSGANSSLNKSISAKDNASGVISANNSSPYLDSELVKPKTPYLVQAGSIIPCVMISGINSDISGQVIAQVRENVYDSASDRYLLIPQGSKLIGSFSNQVAFGQKRLAVAWSRVIYPNGYSIDLKGIPGSDVAGFSGFSDQVDNHYWQIFGSSFVIGLITAGMQYSQNNTNPNVQVGGLGLSTAPSVGQTVAGSLGQQLGQTAMMITQKGINVAPTLTIRQGYMFTIMLTADVALKPYKQD